MKSFLLLAAFAFALPVFACDPLHEAPCTRAPIGIHAKRFPVHLGVSYYYSACMTELVRPSHLHSIWIQPPSLIFVGKSYGIPFDQGAIFCRMENQCLRKFDIKFSIHAGGYRE